MARERRDHGQQLRHRELLTDAAARPESEGPSTGVFQIALVAARPPHVAVRGRPTLTETTRAEWGMNPCNRAAARVYSTRLPPVVQAARPFMNRSAARPVPFGAGSNGLWQAAAEFAAAGE